MSDLSPPNPSNSSPTMGGRSISGAIQSIVPTGCQPLPNPSAFSTAPRFGRRGILDTGAALPKSHSLACKRFSSDDQVSKMFAVLMSRWANPAVCKYVSASATSFMSVGKSSKGISSGTGAGEPLAPANRVALISSARSAFHKFPLVQNSVTMYG